MKMRAARLDCLLGMSTFKEFEKNRASFSELHTRFPHHFLFYLVVQGLIDEWSWKLLFIVISISCFDIMV
jgi:hypothetical protein